MASRRERGWAGRVVLITGVGGFVGSHLARELLARDAVVVGIVRDSGGLRKLDLLGIRRHLELANGDISDPGLVHRVINNYEVDTVFHLAAQTSPQVACRAPVPTLMSNVVGTWNVLEATRLSPLVRSVVVASISDLSDQDGSDPEEASASNLQPYEASKACAELLARSYAASFPLPVVVVRCANVYGPGDTDWSRPIPGTVRQALAGDDPVVSGNARAEADYLYIADAVDGYVTAGERLPEISGQVVHLGTGRRTSTLALVKMILAEVGDSGLQPRLLNEDGATPTTIKTAIDAARKLSGWRPRVSLNDGLALTVGWYREHLATGKVLALGGGR